MKKLTVNRPPDFMEFRKESVNQGIHQRFEEQVRLHPESIALKTKASAFTYAETNGFANSIAAEILSATGKELAQVALLLPNTPDLILAILASLKAHKTYVPLDSNFPKERLQAMIEDAAPVIVLTDDAHINVAEQIAGRTQRIINLSRTNRDASAPNLEVACNPLDAAYILYTSGSTGRPKGITFLHRNLLHTTMCLTNELFFAPSDKVTWLHSPSFGSSVVDIYCCLTNGGTLCPWDTKTQGFTGMANWLLREKVTTLQWIPSAFRQFVRTVQEDTVFHDIRIAVMAGEPLTIREVEIFRRHFPRGSHLVNQLGTAESYNYYLYRVDHDIPIESANVAGGYPVSDDRQLLILDDQRNEMPAGGVGEIAIKSAYMSAGYWRDEVLTKTKFVHLGNDPIPVYLTGDLGRLQPDGCLIHLGRKDYQVKIRGCRIEVAEVEHFLSGVPGVADSAVWVANNHLGEDQLVGYVVQITPGAFNQETAERYLETKLPDYMVPRHYVMLKSLPALLTGKVDRKGLPNPFENNHFEGSTPVAKAGGVQLEIIRIFRELLRLEEIHPHSNFLKLGGDSLLAAVLIHRIHQRFEVDIMFDDFAESPTPAHLATIIKTALDGGWEQPPGRRPPSTAAVAALAEPLPASCAETVIFKRPMEMATKDQPVLPSSLDVRNLIIVGAGQNGRETFTWVIQAIAAGFACRIKGFLDDRANALDGYDYPVKVLAGVRDYQIEKHDVFIGAIGDPEMKVKCYSRIIESGGQFVNVIHPLANIGNNVKLGTGIVMGPFSSVTCDAKIGSHVTIGAFSNAAHDTDVGDWCQISSHCGINGCAKLGPGVFLGSHACVIPSVQVGARAFVGAGSVVVRDVLPGVKVFGNPATPIGAVSRQA